MSMDSDSFGAYVKFAEERLAAGGDLATVVGIRDEVVELRSVAEAKWGRQSDAFLDVSVVERRADRAVGLACRAAQRRGEISFQPSAHPSRRRRNATADIPVQLKLEGAPTAQEAMHVTNMTRKAIYILADLVDDTEFEEILAEAYIERNVSRQNVVRKVEAVAAEDSFAALSSSKKTKMQAGVRKMMDDLAVSMNSLAFIVTTTDPAEVEYDRQDTEDILADMDVIKMFLNKVKGMR